MNAECLPEHLRFLDAVRRNARDLGLVVGEQTRDAAKSGSLADSSSARARPGRGVVHVVEMFLLRSQIHHGMSVADVHLDAGGSDCRQIGMRHADDVPEHVAVYLDDVRRPKTFLAACLVRAHIVKSLREHVLVTQGAEFVVQIDEALPKKFHVNFIYLIIYFQTVTQV